MQAKLSMRRRPVRVRPMTGLTELEPRILLSQVAFFPQRFVAELTSIPAVATADFNGDGRADVATVNNSSFASSMSVFLSNADGTLAPPANYGSEIYPRGIVAADFNGDGKPDIADTSVPGLRVRLNNGDGTFGSGVSYTINPNISASQAICAADVNADGKLDIIVGIQGSICVFLNNGDGSFAPQTVSTGPAYVRSITTADFNDDGKVDIASVGFNGNDTTYSVMLGNGDGTFGAPTSTSLGQIYLYSIVSADFNGDNKIDLAVSATRGKIYILSGNGDGTFTLSATVTRISPGWLVAGDFSGDGKADLATSEYGLFSTVTFLKNDGDGSFATPVVYTVDPN